MLAPLAAARRSDLASRRAQSARRRLCVASSRPSRHRARRCGRWQVSSRIVEGSLLGVTKRLALGFRSAQTPQSSRMKCTRSVTSRVSSSLVTLQSMKTPLPSRLASWSLTRRRRRPDPPASCKPLLTQWQSLLPLRRTLHCRWAHTVDVHESLPNNPRACATGTRQGDVLAVGALLTQSRVKDDGVGVPWLTSASTRASTNLGVRRRRTARHRRPVQLPAQFGVLHARGQIRP